MFGRGGRGTRRVKQDAGYSPRYAALASALDRAVRPNAATELFDPSRVDVPQGRAA
jgi:hypothetical protein